MNKFYVFFNLTFIVILLISIGILNSCMSSNKKVKGYPRSFSNYFIIFNNDDYLQLYDSKDDITYDMNFFYKEDICLDTRNNGEYILLNSAKKDGINIFEINSNTQIISDIIVNKSMNLFAKYSHDFKFIAFCSDMNLSYLSNNWNLNLYLYELDSRSINQITASYSETHPSWNNTDNDILYTKYFEDKGPKLYSLNLQTKESTFITNGKNGQYFHQNNNIVYEGIVDDQSQIFIYQSDKKNSVQLTFDKAFHITPDISNDDLDIVYIKKYSDKLQLCIFNLISGNSNLFNEFNRCYSPLWIK